MSLRTYRAKRHFDATPEPKGGKSGKGVRHFVVQKHDASHLHYDLRLEWGGVLKSWAVPKGPPRTHEEKRLAVHVEDHPLSYRRFAGVIPKGNYGAGTVEIWDEGTYTVRGAVGARKTEKAMKAAYAKGELEVIFHGKKMKGTYVLVRMDGGKVKNGWLLMKKRSHGRSLHNTKPMLASSFTNAEKIFWPKEKITKGDLLTYYQKVAPILLPHLKDRPMSLHRFPNGIEEEGFFQKDVLNTPKFAKTIAISSDVAEKEVHYLLCNNKKTLEYMVQLGSIEMNPWNSRVKSLDNPDYLILDLDPEEQTPLANLIKVARVIRDILEDVGVECYCKTSGSAGLHIYVPLGAKYDYEQTRVFAKLLAHIVNNKLPDITSTERGAHIKGKRVHLDYPQNRRGATTVAAYSVRPKPGATVSTPLKWSEVKAGLDPKKFTIHTVPARLKKMGDLWKPVLGKGIDLKKCLERLAAKQK